MDSSHLSVSLTLSQAGWSVSDLIAVLLAASSVVLTFFMGYISFKLGMIPSRLAFMSRLTSLRTDIYADLSNRRHWFETMRKHVHPDLSRAQSSEDVRAKHDNALRIAREFTGFRKQPAGADFTVLSRELLRHAYVLFPASKAVIATVKEISSFLDKIYMSLNSFETGYFVYDIEKDKVPADPALAGQYRTSAWVTYPEVEVLKLVGKLQDSVRKAEIEISRSTALFSWVLRKADTTRKEGR